MTRAFDVSLVTYEAFPTLTADDQLLLAALRRMGLRVRSSVWSDERVDWGASTLSVIRSTWDYFHRIAEFRAWLDRVETQTELVNTPQTVRWNMDKHYLSDLGDRGIRVVPSRFIDRGSSPDLAGVALELDARDIVIKPTISGSAFGAKRFDLAKSAAEADRHARDLLSAGDVMIQPYLPAVEVERERSLIFFGTEFSHAYRKAPFNGGPAHGEAQETDHDATSAEITFGQEAIGASRAAPAYARVDIVPAEHGSLLMELELIEPSLLFRRKPGSADVLAAHLQRLCVARASTHEPAV